jgi:hypothetical protein
MEAALMLSRYARCFAALSSFFLMVCFQPAALPAQTAGASLGIFEGQSDVGSVMPAGTAVYDAASGVYTLTSAGANLWSTADGFHFVWKKLAGDVVLTADIAFPVTTGHSNPHRKGVLILRQTLDADSVYADAAQHGSGLMALQYRPKKGATTQDIEMTVANPGRLRLEKRGDTITMFLSKAGEPLHQVGASIKLHFDGTFYAGIGLCSHDKDVVEKATFAHVEVTKPAPATGAKLALYSTLQTIGIQDSDRPAAMVYTGRESFDAPVWTKDGSSLIFSRGGKLWKIPVEGGTPTAIETGAAEHCGGSHGLSPDGKWLAATCSMPGSPEARIYMVPVTGGAPRRVTEHPDSYFHTWSPDGKTIAFARPSHGSGNIYAISVEGGEETALTTGNGISDDPDYSADGKYIYFNSDRAGGLMQIWRMRADGSQPEQLTFDEYNNWTPHPSPDGKSVLILSFDKSVTGHPANKDVTLRILTPNDGKIRTLVNLVGGSGTDNVNNWAPDGAHFAFVSYQMLPENETGSSE